MTVNNQCSDFPSLHTRAECHSVGPAGITVILKEYNHVIYRRISLSSGRHYHLSQHEGSMDFHIVQRIN
jgi:hypothetical protein